MRRRAGALRPGRGRADATRRATPSSRVLHGRLTGRGHAGPVGGISRRRFLTRVGHARRGARGRRVLQGPRGRVGLVEPGLHRGRGRPDRTPGDRPGGPGSGARLRAAPRRHRVGPGEPRGGRLGPPRPGRRVRLRGRPPVAVGRARDRGRIVAERQWGVAPGWSRDIASCQKSVVAVLCVIGRDEGWLDLDASVTDVVGAGWSLEGDARAEARITVRHLMSMTSGLDPGLRVAAEPGTVWEYDNDAYHRLHAVLEAAAGTDLETLTRSRLWEPIGVRGARWVRRAGTGRVSVDAAGHPLSGLVMNAYDLARFALLVQRRGRWGDRTVVPAGAIDELLSPSSDLNPSYGLLWWLNGADAHRLPGRNPPLVAGPLVPGAPSDLVAALGANGQKAYVAPSLDSVLTRLGRSASGELLSALSGFDDEWWTRLGAARVA
ncbi:MAG: beta-lactamase family protein [Acidimicrobiia bacterium]|nr:beta-lactamase family protein [Acidimicrobiia bacterium]